LNGIVYIISFFPKRVISRNLIFQDIQFFTGGLKVLSIAMYHIECKTKKINGFGEVKFYEK